MIIHVMVKIDDPSLIFCGNLAKMSGSFLIFLSMCLQKMAIRLVF